MGLFGTKDEPTDEPQPLLLPKKAAVWSQSLKHHGGASPWLSKVTLKIGGTLHVDEYIYWGDPIKAKQYLDGYGEAFRVWCKFQNDIEFEREHVCP